MWLSFIRIVEFQTAASLQFLVLCAIITFPETNTISQRICEFFC